MSLALNLKGILILGSILSLIALGFAITLRSGVADLVSGSGFRRLFLNFSQTILVLGICVLGLALIQLAVGFNLTLM